MLGVGRRITPRNHRKDLLLEKKRKKIFVRDGKKKH